MSIDLRTVRVEFGPVGKGECADVKVEWVPPFETNDYTASATVEDTSPGSESLSVDRLRERTPTSAIFQVSNRADESRSGILHAFAKGKS